MGKIYFLGTGTGWRHCLNRELKNASLPVLRRCTSLVVGLPKGNLLVDVPPSFADTWNTFRYQLFKRKKSLEPIRAVFFTHQHFDHWSGLGDLIFAQDRENCEEEKNAQHDRSVSVSKVFGPEKVFKMINPVCRRLFSEERDWQNSRVIFDRVDQPFDCLGEHVTVFPLNHGQITSWGLRIGGFSYIPDCGEIPKASQKIIAGSRTIIMECNSVNEEQQPKHLNLTSALEYGRKFAGQGLEHLALVHLGQPFDQPGNKVFIKKLIEQALFKVTIARDFMELSLPE